jgi:hypothetical protein
MLGIEGVRSLFLRGEDKPSSPTVASILAENERLIKELREEIVKTRAAFGDTTPLPDISIGARMRAQQMMGIVAPPPKEGK